MHKSIILLLLVLLTGCSAGDLPSDGGFGGEPSDNATGATGSATGGSATGGEGSGTGGASGGAATGGGGSGGATATGGAAPTGWRLGTTADVEAGATWRLEITSYNMPWPCDEGAGTEPLCDFRVCFDQYFWDPDCRDLPENVSTFDYQISADKVSTAGGKDFYIRFSVFDRDPAPADPQNAGTWLWSPGDPFEGDILDLLKKYDENFDRLERTFNYRVLVKE